MDKDEVSWLDIALDKAERATARKLTVMFCRMQDTHDKADVIVTNATTPEMVQALAAAVGAEQRS